MKERDWQVPDKARLSTLETRRLWLSRVEIVYALPRVGALWIENGEPRLAWDADGTVVYPQGDHQPWGGGEAEAFRSEWQDLWLRAGASGSCTVLLHARGLFRVVQVAEGALPGALRSAR